MPCPLAAMFFHRSGPFSNSSEISIKPMFWPTFMMIGQKLWLLVFTRFLYSQKRKTAPPIGSHVFQRIGTTFELNQDIIKTNILTKLHEDWAWNVTSTVFTRFFFFWPSDLVSDPAQPSFDLGRDFIGTKLLTKFHEDGTRNVASRVFTSKC